MAGVGEGAGDGVSSTKELGGWAGAARPGAAADPAADPVADADVLELETVFVPGLELGLGLVDVDVNGDGEGNAADSPAAPAFSGIATPLPPPPAHPTAVSTTTAPTNQIALCPILRANHPCSEFARSTFR